MSTTTKYEILVREAHRVADIITKADLEHEAATGAMFAQLPEHALRPIAAALFEAAAACPEHRSFRVGDRVRHRLRAEILAHYSRKKGWTPPDWERGVYADEGAEIAGVCDLRDPRHEVRKRWASYCTGSDWDTQVIFDNPARPGKEYVSFTAAYFERVPASNKETSK